MNLARTIIAWTLLRAGTPLLVSGIWLYRAANRIEGPR